MNEGHATYLWNTEIRIDDAESAKPCPEEGSVILPVPGGRVDHVWGQDRCYDADNVLLVVSGEL